MCQTTLNIIVSDQDPKGSNLGNSDNRTTERQRRNRKKDGGGGRVWTCVGGGGVGGDGCDYRCGD